MFQYENAEKISLQEISLRFLNISFATFKKNLNKGIYPESLTNLIVNDSITTADFAHYIDNLNKEESRMLNTENQLTPYAVNQIVLALENEFGTSLIPYSEVAARYLGWTKEKTAMAKLNDGTIKNLKLPTIKLIPSSKCPVFVLAKDLAEFLLASRNVEISH